MLLLLTCSAAPRPLPLAPRPSPPLAQIVSDGEATEDIYRVLAGRVRVEKGDYRTPVGQGAVVNRIQEGQTFGEMSFLDTTATCANCIADTDEVHLLKVPKAELAEKLQGNPRLARDFYKHMAIAVTQRLSIVSAASAEIPEAPRGAAQPLDVGAAKDKELSPAKLLKVRRRFNIPDSVAMACMMKATCVKEKSRKMGTIYVFETAIGFVHKVFGVKQHECFSFAAVSEVLRETFTLKSEDGGIELQLNNDKVVQFFPVNVDECHEAIHRCRSQYEHVFQGTDPTPPQAHGGIAAALLSGVSTPRGGGGAADASGADRKTGRRGSGLAAPDLAFSMNPHAGQTTARNREEGRAAEEAMGALLNSAELRKYKAGDTIIENGTKHMTLFNLAKGKVAVEVQRLNEDTQLMQSVKILTLYEGAIFGEMSFLNGDVACAAVVAEVPCELYEIKATTVDAMLADGGQATQAAFYRHLGTYLTHRVRQLTAMVGEALASRVIEVPLEEVLSNGVFFLLFKRFLEEKRLVDKRVLSFLEGLNQYLDMPANADQLAYGRKLHAQFLAKGADGLGINVPGDALSSVTEQLRSDAVPPRSLFAPVLDVVLASLQVNAYRLFSQSSAFQALLDLKVRETAVPAVTDFKLLQILGEGYEGKVLQARKKDCGVCYALKVLDKKILASRSRRWMLHCSRELECLKLCANHPYVVGLAYSFQTPQYLYMVQEYLPNQTFAAYLDNHEGHPVALHEIRFCCAELACGLHHIHSMDIVYRDLKPANVLIDDEGHMRIVDFGMASLLDPETKRRKSVCGTKRYMAPEMKEKIPYNASVDWYSLGVLILDCQGRPQYGERMQREWAAARLDRLVDELLVKNPDKRLGCDGRGFSGLQAHPFFADVDWSVVDMRKWPSPLRWEWYRRENDVAMSRQFRNGEDLTNVIDKLQTLVLDAHGQPESGPGEVPDWDFVNPRAVYREYVSSPYMNYKMPLQF